MAARGPRILDVRDPEDQEVPFDEFGDAPGGKPLGGGGTSTGTAPTGTPGGTSTSGQQGAPSLDDLKRQRDAAKKARDDAKAAALQADTDAAAGSITPQQWLAAQKASDTAQKEYDRLNTVVTQAESRVATRQPPTPQKTPEQIKAEAQARAEGTAAGRQPGVGAQPRETTAGRLQAQSDAGVLVDTPYGKMPAAQWARIQEQEQRSQGTAQSALDRLTYTQGQLNDRASANIANQQYIAELRASINELQASIRSGDAQADNALGRWNAAFAYAKEAPRLNSPYQPGFEPGGPVERWRQESGRPYDAEQYRQNPVDPFRVAGQIYEMAQQQPLMPGGGQGAAASAAAMAAPAPAGAAAAFLDAGNARFGPPQAEERTGGGSFTVESGGGPMAMAAPAQPRQPGQGISDHEIYQIARTLGFDDDAARVAVAIAYTENGRGGAVGDGGKSFGPYQFYSGGQLANYAKRLGMDPMAAGRYAIEHQDDAVQWALSSYLGNTIRDGQQQGLRGPSLATYAQRFGQVSVNPEKSGENYLRVQSIDFTNPGGGPAAQPMPTQPPQAPQRSAAASAAPAPPVGGAVGVPMGPAGAGAPAMVNPAQQPWEPYVGPGPQGQVQTKGPMASQVGTSAPPPPTYSPNVPHPTGLPPGAGRTPAINPPEAVNTIDPETSQWLRETGGSVPFDEWKRRQRGASSSPVDPFVASGNNQYVPDYMQLPPPIPEFGY